MGELLPKRGSSAGGLIGLQFVAITLIAIERSNVVQSRLRAFATRPRRMAH
jgi:hypothetical protein